MPTRVSLMANQLVMDESFAIHNLRSVGYSERRIAQTLARSRAAAFAACGVKQYHSANRLQCPVGTSRDGQRPDLQKQSVRALS